MRALDEDMSFLLLLLFFSTGPGSFFWEFHPSSVTLGTSRGIIIKVRDRGRCTAMYVPQAHQVDWRIPEKVSDIISILILSACTDFRVYA